MHQQHNTYWKGSLTDILTYIFECDFLEVIASVFLIYGYRTKSVNCKQVTKEKIKTVQLPKVIFP